MDDTVTAQLRSTSTSTRSDESIDRLDINAVLTWTIRYRQISARVPHRTREFDSFRHREKGPHEKRCEHRFEDSDDALMHAEEEIDDSAQDGGVLGGRSDWGTDPRPAVEIDEEAEGDYAVGERVCCLLVLNLVSSTLDESGVQRGGGSHRRPGPRPAVHIDEDLFRSWPWFLDVHSLESNGSRCSWDLLG